MSNIPTAEEFIQNYNMEFNKDGKSPLVHILIEFAKLHCEAQLKAILKNVKTKDEWEGNTGSEYCDTVVDKDSIKNAYDLNQIK